MESIGEKLKTAREAKKLSLKEVAKETNIIQKYIEALENEDFDKFPGETYIIGFLRTYSDFLKVNAEELIQAYRGYKISESATPLEELTKPTRMPILANLSSLYNKYRNAFYITGIASVLLILIWLFSSISSSDIEYKEDDSIRNIKDEYRVSKKSEIENIRNLQLTNERGYTLVYIKEAVQFLVENKEVMFLLQAIKDSTVTMEVLPGNTIITLEMEKPKVLNIEDCPREVVFTLKGLTEKRAKIMVVLGKKLEVEEKVAEKETDKTVEPDNKVTTQSEKTLKIIFEAEFIKKTYVELYLDGMKKKKGIIAAGSKERWEAAEYIQIKIGNAGGLKAKINGKDYTFGLPGQVANKIITWKKDVKDPNIYRILIKDW